MALAPPPSLSPSKVSAFTECALAFRFSAIDQVPEPASLATTRGTLVHRALELLMCRDAGARTLEAALADLGAAWDEQRTHPATAELDLDAAGEDQLLHESAELVRRYFDLEDPRTITPIGLELKLEVVLDGLRLRGIIDRLDLDADGRLVVTDYKTGRAPAAAYEQRRLAGVQFYSYLCERLFGQRPARIQLLHLAEPVAIVHRPTAQSSRGLETRVRAVWAAVLRSCEREDFGPRPSGLCDWCAFRQWCPAWGGDPSAAPRPAAAPPAPG